MGFELQGREDMLSVKQLEDKDLFRKQLHYVPKPIRLIVGFLRVWSVIKVNRHEASLGPYKISSLWASRRHTVPLGVLD